MSNKYVRHLTDAFRRLSKAERAIFFVLIYLIITFVCFDLSRCSFHHLEQGSKAFESGDVEQALHLYQKAGAHGDQAILKMAEQLKAEGRYEEAIYCCNALLSDESISPEDQNTAHSRLFGIGLDLEKQEKYSLALKCFEPSSVSGSAAHACYCKGMLSLESGMKKDAAKYFAKSKGLGDEQLISFANQAKKEGDAKHAAVYLAYCYDTETSQKGHYALGKYQLKDGHYKAAAKQFAQGGKSGKKRLLKMAKSAYSKHEWKKARVCYLALGGNKNKQRAELCVALYRFEGGHYSGALSSLQRIKTKGMPKGFKNTVKSYAVECHYWIGVDQFEKNHWKKAYKHLKKAKGYKNADYLLSVCKENISAT